MKNGLRIFFLIVFFLGSLCFFISAEENLDSTNNKNAFLILPLDNKIIGPVVASYIKEGIEEAESNQYSGLILVLDTPGGLLESTRMIVKDIMNAKIPKKIAKKSKRQPRTILSRRIRKKRKVLALRIERIPNHTQITNPMIERIIATCTAA